MGDGGICAINNSWVSDCIWRPHTIKYNIKWAIWFKTFIQLREYEAVHWAIHVPVPKVAKLKGLF